ncbi:Glycosidase [Mucilaginibacter lappiensis]|uniref:Glycosidase n=1 Tax=Mucilaginibacter lappiensis TaxID=354630 RepID=A0ABR6PJT8_9SPHI|nr:alpha-amylase family glycosyl hydrolase [Mucilaginibacter lappiensis]MBB6110036.1 glycosidase [Mucilaginibacter lappiensis]SIR54785.1 Glycosidase [Mucilaginibacter lappiensis]
METKSYYLLQNFIQRIRNLAVSLFLIALSQSAFGQDPAQYGTPFAGVPNPMDVNLYQVNIRPFSTAGNLAGVTARLDNIKAVGTNVIYLMPVYPHGTDAKSSISPYCIKDFTSVGSEYGTLSDLQALVDGAHSRGMAVILDFVVNGTSWDHPWTTQHPDWYNRDGSGNILQLATFPDVAALNFSNTSMRTAIINAMRYWVFAANIDGFRCDFANNPPLDFWTQAIGSLRGITTHNLLMFAEGDHQNLFQGGFDYNFGDQFYYNALKPIRKNGDNVATDITNSTNYEYANASGTNQVIRYTDNHDVDGSSDGNALTIFGGSAGVMANFVVCAYMRGVPFLFGSQEVAFNQQIFWPYTNVKIDWSQNANVTAEFAKVLNYRTSSTAIRRGTMTNYSDANVCAFTKVSGSEKVVVLVNLRGNSSTYTIPSALAGSYKDAYSGTTVTLTSGATQTLNSFQYLVYTNQNVAQVPVTGVSVAPTSATIAAGLTQQLIATIAPTNATNTNVTWTSSNTAVATVSATGLVTAIAAGTATITVKTQDGSKTATSSITVTPGTSFTVYFSPPPGWSTGIKIYWWNALPSGVLADGSWPGVTMTNNGNGWYSYTFTNITSTNLIFNDGSNQTDNLSRNKTGWYVNGTWYDSNPGTSGSITYYQIVNRYQANNYLYDAGNGKVAYGTSATTNAYQWTKIDAGNGYYLLKNRATGNLMHVEDQNGNVECTTGNTTWYSAMWSTATATDGWSYIQNRWQTNEWINIEHLTGYAEYAGAQAGWYSAMWQFVNPVTGT